MFERFGGLVLKYAKKHWDSELPENLRFSKEDAILAAERFLAGKRATKNGSFVRLVGQSGVGKTTQLLPAAEEYYRARMREPILVAAREFVELHPHYREILEKYGEAELRRRTDDFATIVMFYVLVKLTQERADFILDLSFVGTKIEWMFELMAKNYDEKTYLMMVVPEWKNLELLEGRGWRHGAELEAEFRRATKNGLEFYRKREGRIVMWGFDSLEPIFDGEFAGAEKVFECEMEREGFLERDEKTLAEQKKHYLKKIF